MNCLECRRQLLTHPGNLDASCQAHLQQCTDCANEHQQLLEMERQLQQMREVKPPEGLRERLIMRGHYQAKKRQTRVHWAMALAASLLLGIGVTTYLPGNADPLATNVLAHVNDELQHLREVKNNSPASLQLLASSLGGSYQDHGMPVNYAGRCQVRSGPGLHLVLRGQQGPVTVLIMPGEFLAEELPIADQRFRGRIFRAPYGSFAVLGESNEAITPVAKQVRESISIDL